VTGKGRPIQGPPPRTPSGADCATLRDYTGLIRSAPAHDDGMAVLLGLHEALQLLEYHFFSVAGQFVTTVIELAWESPSSRSRTRNRRPSADG
jgi:hypothetical protein